MNTASAIATKRSYPKKTGLLTDGVEQKIRKRKSRIRPDPVRSFVQVNAADFQ